MTALLYLIQIYRVVDRFKGLRVQGCGSGFAANSNGALRAGPISLPHGGRGTASAVDRVLSYIVDLRRISPLIFHTARTLSGSLRSPPSPRGEGFVRRYCFSTYACIRSGNARKAVFSYRSLPLGEGYGYTRNVIKTRGASIF